MLFSNQAFRIQCILYYLQHVFVPTKQLPYLWWCRMRLLYILKTSLLTNQVVCHVEVFPHILGFSNCIPMVAFESIFCICCKMSFTSKGCSDSIEIFLVWKEYFIWGAMYSHQRAHSYVPPPFVMVAAVDYSLDPLFCQCFQISGYFKCYCLLAVTLLEKGNFKMYFIKGKLLTVFIFFPYVYQYSR